MPKIADPWAEMDRQVLDALSPHEPRTAGQLHVDLPDEHVRAALKQLARAGHVRVHRNAARTAYTKVA